MDLQQEFTNAATAPASVAEAVRRSDFAAMLAALEAGAPADKPDSAGKTPLFIAAEQGNLYLAGILLGYGANVNATAPGGQTVLRAAIGKGDDLVDLFLQFGADPLAGTNTSEQEYLLQRAAVSGTESAVIALLGNGLSPHRTWEKEQASLLVLAARKGRAAVADLLIKAGVDVNKCDSEGRSALRGALKSGNVECVNTLLAAGADPDNEAKIDPSAPWKTERDYALAQECGGEIAAAVKAAYKKFEVNKAAATGDSKTVKELLEDGQPADTCDRHGKTALIYACNQKDAGIVALLLAHGADPARSGPDGLTPLSVSVRQRDVQSVVTLITVGASIHETALYDACCARDGEMVKTLLRHGATLESALDGASLIVIAVKNNDTVTAEALLGAGASAYAKDADGQTAFQLAEKSNNSVLIDLMKARRNEEIEVMAEKSVRLDQQVSALKRIKFRPSN